MDQKQIRQKYASIISKMEALEEDLDSLQNECLHPNVQKEYKSDTGNYDPTADSYWIDWKCPDCKKWWITDQ